jgi:4'-phosphopantetheinyl transferase
MSEAQRSTEVEVLPGSGELAAPTGRQLQVWWARVSVGHLDDALRQALAADLDAATVTRMERFVRIQDRDRGLAAHSLLRRVLAAVTGGPPSAVTFATRCAGCGETDHGKPFLDVGQEVPPVQVNLSHSGELVCVALAGPGVQVGVDVEQSRKVDWDTLRRSVFADPEWAVTEAAADPVRRRLEAWTRKEAAVKSSGHGLSLPFRDVPIDDAAWGGWTAELPSAAGAVAGWDLDLVPDAAAAVGVHDPDQAQQPERPVVHQVDLARR